MARLLAILFICFPSFVMAGDGITEKYSPCIDINRCSQEMRDYLWQDKSEEIAMKIEELTNDLQHAIGSQDYSMLKKYLKFPVAFYIEDNGTEEHFASNNIREFTYQMHSFFSNNSKLSYHIQYNRFSALHVAHSTYVWLSSSHISLGIDIKCDSFIPNQYQEYPVLPDDIATCSATQIVIEHISLNSN